MYKIVKFQGSSEFSILSLKPEDRFKGPKGPISKEAPVLFMTLADAKVWLPFIDRRGHRKHAQES